MKILIRADASLRLGSGHVMRCLCLADQLSVLGHRVTFASVDLPEYLSALIARSGHELFVIPDERQLTAFEAGAWPSSAQLNDAAASAGSDDYDLIVVDHYGLGLEWERAAMQSGGQVMVIDDLGREHACRLLLDQNFYQNPISRYSAKLPPACRQLLGPHYALMRPEFAEARRTPHEDSVRRILVFIGGMDSNDVTSHVLRALNLGLPHDPAVDVVIGRHHPNRQAIETQCSIKDNWSCHVQTDRMAQLLSGADLVIGSGGTNTWERMTVGVATLALCIAENQRVLLDECAAAGLLTVPDDNVLADAQALHSHIIALLGNVRLRQHLALVGMQTVDGLGARRVARAAEALVPLSVRMALADDADMLLSWRNHKNIRAISRNKAVIASEAHRDWCHKVLVDPKRSLLIGESDSVPIGCVRFDEIGPDVAEISIYVAPERIGTGVGSRLLAAAETWLKNNRRHITRIEAEVLAENAASSNLFKRAGYSPLRAVYSKDLHI